MAEKQTIKVPAQITAIAPKADGTVSISLKAEMPAIEKIILFDQLKKSGWFIFSPDEIGQEEVPEKDSEFGIQKSLSGRLRAVLFLNWKMLTDQSMNFEDFRKEKMEEIMTFYKKQLPQRETL